MPGELARMALKWRIDGVFWTCALEKRGPVFTRVELQGPVVQKPVNVNPGLVEILWPKL